MKLKKRRRGIIMNDKIVELIYNKLQEVHANNFEPKFVVLNRTAYSSLCAYLIENQYNSRLVGLTDGLIPNTIFGYTIVLIPDGEDVLITTDARIEFRYDVRMEI